MDTERDILQRAIYLGRAEVVDLERMIEENTGNLRRRLVTTLGHVDQSLAFMRDKLAKLEEGDHAVSTD